jgi:hypothetical protein
MRTLMLLFVAAMLGGFAPTTLHAAFITGEIGFTGGTQLNTGSAGTATGVTDWVGVVVDTYNTTGDFASLPNSTASFSAPWNFDTILPITNFWNVGGFKFELVSSSVSVQASQYPFGHVVMDGTGTISGNGYMSTAVSW